MYSHSFSEIFENEDCTIVLRRVQGPDAKELFASCHPTTNEGDTQKQTEAIYRALAGILENEGGSFASVVSETVFLRELHANLALFRRERQQLILSCQTTAFRPAILEIEQPPLNERAQLEVSIQAVIPNTSSLQMKAIKVVSDCKCNECKCVQGLKLQVGNETRFYVSGLCGQGKNAYEQTHSMFKLTEELLRQAGMRFTDVARTWIHLREIDRDYGDLNRARREFFEAHRIDPVPASTGIEGGQASAAHDLSLGVYAVKATLPQERHVMTSATLNEAEEYGADFVRGMKVVESNKIALLVSGTASINEVGETAYVDDFESQVDRMLVNVAALLEKQAATFEDIVSATTYLKHRENTKRLQEKFLEAGFTGFPNVLVEARVCRPDLLCETEVLAVLPK